LSYVAAQRAEQGVTYNSKMLQSVIGSEAGEGQ
jgi:hypothetical protein